MRTSHTQTENRQTKFQAKTKPFFTTVISVLLLLVVMAASALAVDSVWLTNPGSGFWNVNGNWNPATAPVNDGDTATFNTSSRTFVDLSDDVTIDSVTFNPGASSFTIYTGFSIPGPSFNLVGVGIVNISGTTQTISNNFGGTTNFLNSSTAANATIINSDSGSGAGVTYFQDTSTAANATITNDGGTTNFLNNSTAANATITNEGGTTNFFGTSNAGSAIIFNNFGTTNFLEASTAANATITNNGGDTEFFDTSNAGSATISNDFGGFTGFLNSSTAANATIINSNSGSSAGATFFRDASTAANATITNNSGGATEFLDTSNAGSATITNNGSNLSFKFSGITRFQNASSAGSATLIANGDSEFGGLISFEDESTGGSARVEVFGNGVLNISLHTAPGVIVGSIEGSGSVQLGANNLTVGSNNLSTLFSGMILEDFEGTGGSLTKIGTGILTLSGNNSYHGSTSINAGTLSISSDANLGTAPDAPVANQLTFDGGTLQVTAGFALNSNRGITLLGGGGTIAVTNANVLSYAGVITGAGSLTKAGTGTLLLSGLNTYAGATAVTGGVLRAGVANTLPSQTTLSVTAGATFDLNNFAHSIGSLAGAGSVTLGTATLTTGNNNTSTDFSGVISGAGALSKVGSGTFNLSGLNTYTGATTVNAGSLLVNGSVGSAQTSVNPGGLLGGRGSLDGSLTNGGVVTPGNPLGTLRVAGNYTQTAGGTLRLEIAGLGDGQHDLLAVRGTASLAGTLQIVPLNGFDLRVGDQVTLLTATGGVNGTFDFVQADTILRPEVIYLSDTIVLQQTQNSFAEIARDECESTNHVAVGTALDSAVGDPRAADLIDFLNSESLSTLCRDFDLLAPEKIAAIFNVGVSIANIQTANLQRRMDDIRAGSSGFSAAGFAIETSVRDFSEGFAGPTGPEGKSGPSIMQPRPDNRWGFFVSGLGEFTSVGDTNNARGYDLSTGGMTLGVDYRLSPNFAIGLTAGYANTGADLADNGDLDVNGGKLGVYATAFSGGFYVNAAATGGLSDYETRRTALLGAASGDTEGSDFTGLLAAGYDWKKGGLTFGPTASFQYTYVEFDGFTEEGSLAPLAFNEENASSSRTALGAKVSYDCHVGHVPVRPEIRAAWQHEFGDTDYSLTSRFANGAGNPFTVNGPAIGRDSLLVGAGAAVFFNDRVSAYAYYDGELLRSNYISNNVSAGVRISF